jgi:hypothetical protein
LKPFSLWSGPEWHRTKTPMHTACHEIFIFFMSMNPGTYFPLIYINQKRVSPQSRMKMDFDL